jgi:hypothetical protein
MFKYQINDKNELKLNKMLFLNQDKRQKIL